MVYRIRYRKSEKGRDMQCLVEANSPTEAMIKFRHTSTPQAAQSAADNIVSVCAAEDSPPPAEEPVNTFSW